ncbi:ribonuclease H-like domain-containing protein [Tanacetum coccineum]
MSQNKLGISRTTNLWGKQPTNSSATRQKLDVSLCVGADTPYLLDGYDILNVRSIEAMLDEYNALVNNGTWVFVPRLANVNVVRSMWHFNHKFKARLVANGRSQQQGINCDETFSPVVKPAIIHTVLSLTVSRDWPNHQLDVKNAFLHGYLSEMVYMYQPLGFVDPTRPDYVCHLQKLLYGLKQDPWA